MSNKINVISQWVLERLTEDLGVPPIFLGDGSCWAYNKDTGTWKPYKKQLETYLWTLPEHELFRDTSERVNVNINLIRQILTYLSVVQGRDGYPFDTKPGCAFENGFKPPILHTFLPNEPANLAVFGFPFNYKHNPNPQRFHELMRDKLFYGDDDVGEKIQLVGQFIGACALGVGASMQKALLFWGEHGQNGKSTLLELIESLFPENSVSHVSPSSWSSKNAISNLLTSRINIVADIANGEIVESENLKKLITGDKLQVKKLYKDEFSFKPICGHAFSCNILPSTRDTSNGFWRRFVVLTFNNVFKSAEFTIDQIKDMHLEERADVVSWGIQELLARPNWAYTIPASSNVAQSTWQSSVDVVKEFMSDCMVIDDGECLLSDIYAEFCHWVSGTGHKRIGRNTFGERLKNLGVKRQVRVDGRFYNCRLLGREEWRNYTKRGF